MSKHRETLQAYLQVISGAVDDMVGGRPVEDAVGEIGATVDAALALLRGETGGEDDE